MSTAQQEITSQNVDLSNCDREQIQFSGAILPHGVLLTAAEPDLIILQVSANAEPMLGLNPEALERKSLASILNASQIAGLLSKVNTTQLATPSHFAEGVFNGARFDLFVHRRDSVLILEFERRSQEADIAKAFSSKLGHVLTSLKEAKTLQALLDTAVIEIRKITGFDRVLAYSFEEDGSGWVRSESLNSALDQPTYLHLHYPASDIPQPSRRLFTLTWLRHQPDINYVPVPIVPSLNPLTGESLDLSCAFLRSVSVMYVDYLKNMGTRASMVMTLLEDDKLWGLIACHHHSGPLHIAHEGRLSCEHIAQTVSLLVGSKEEKEHAEYRHQIKSTESKITRNLLRSTDFIDALVVRSPNILDLLAASGAALVLENVVYALGKVPINHEILLLADCLSGIMNEDVFATDCVRDLLPEANRYKHVCSGLLAIRLRKTKRDFIFWFRPEQITTVNWAGDPTKAVIKSSDGVRLMPRTSFAIWKQTVDGRSEPWMPLEISAASELRTAILEIVLEKAEAAGRLYEDLQRSHAELDAFAYIASHDLKEPIRGITNYVDMLREDHAGSLNDDGKNKLLTIRSVAHRMDGLLNSLLEYSRVGRLDFENGRVDLNQVASEVLDSLRSLIESNQAQIRIAGLLPIVRGDSIRLGEVLQNLITNAIKYNNRTDKWVEIGSSPDAVEGKARVYVRDNGFGIGQEHFGRIFEIFRRLHGRNEFGGGSGVGLTIARRIIERHNGRIWVESKLGEGSIFWFTLDENG